MVEPSAVNRVVVGSNPTLGVFLVAIVFKPFNLLSLMSGELIIFLATAFFFIASGGYLIYKIRKSKTPALFPISVYFISMAVFFVLMGINYIVEDNVVILCASLAMIFGASFMARIPIHFMAPGREKLIYYIFLIFGLTISLYSFTLGSAVLQLRAAHLFSFFLVGVFTVGFIFYNGFNSRHSVVRFKSVTIGIILSFYGVVGHGLTALHLMPLVIVPFVGTFDLELPMVFVVLTPITFFMLVSLSWFFKTFSSNSNQTSGKISIQVGDSK